MQRPNPFTHKLFAVAALILSITGCSAPKVKPTAALEGKTIQTVVVLPPQSGTAVTRERLGILRTALQNELSNQGFVVVDDAVVDATCNDSTCSGRSALIAKYPIDAFATLTIDSASRNNFVAGYYNAIVGRLILDDVEGTSLLEVRHTESERGGLLFNSGQILQGVISQIRNGDDAAFATLADKFAHAVVLSIPRSPNAAPSAPPEPPVISATSIDAERDGVYRVCADGSPHAFAAIVLQSKARTNLREISTGRYCGNYLVVSPQQFMGATLELRDAFGTATSATLGALPPKTTDSCSGAVVVEQTGRGTRFLSPCPTTTRRLLVYSAPGSAGPFIKIAEASGPAWTERKASAPRDRILAFIAVDQNGLLSEPKIHQPTPKEGA